MGLRSCCLRCAPLFIYSHSLRDYPRNWKLLCYTLTIPYRTDVLYFPAVLNISSSLSRTREATRLPKLFWNMWWSLIWFSENVLFDNVVHEIPITEYFLLRFCLRKNHFDNYSINQEKLEQLLLSDGDCSFRHPVNIHFLTNVIIEMIVIVGSEGDQNFNYFHNFQDSPKLSDLIADELLDMSVEFEDGHHLNWDDMCECRYCRLYIVILFGHLCRTRLCASFIYRLYATVIATILTLPSAVSKNILKASELSSLARFRKCQTIWSPNMHFECSFEKFRNSLWRYEWFTYCKIESSVCVVSFSGLDRWFYCLK